MELSLDVSFMKSLQEILEDQIRDSLGGNYHVERLIPLSGGDINEVFRIETNKESFCIKLNDALLYPQMFEKEAEGLKTLSRSSFKVPEVITTDSFQEYGFIIMEYIEAGNPGIDFWKKFASSLADLHSITNDQFGWNDNNYIGTLTQINQSHSDWADFLHNSRFIPMVKTGIQKGHLTSQDLFYLEKLNEITKELYKNVRPNLIHGDLWSGNFMVDSHGDPVLIDPAVYYGHSDMDISMTKLFGGFSEELYQYYNEINRQDENWELRIKICKLYPLLVHVNLFGGYYVQQYRDLIQRII